MMANFAQAQTCDQPKDFPEKMVNELTKGSGTSCADAFNTILGELEIPKISFPNKMNLDYETQILEGGRGYRLDFGKKMETSKAFLNEDSQAGNIEVSQDGYSLSYRDIKITTSQKPRLKDPVDWKNEYTTFSADTTMTFRLYKLSDSNCLISPVGNQVETTLTKTFESQVIGKKTEQQSLANSEISKLDHFCEQGLSKANSQYEQAKDLNLKLATENMFNRTLALCQAIANHNKAVYQEYGAQTWDQFLANFNKEPSQNPNPFFQWDKKNGETVFSSPIQQINFLINSLEHSKLFLPSSETMQQKYNLLSAAINSSQNYLLALVEGERKLAKIKSNIAESKSIEAELKELSKYLAQAENKTLEQQFQKDLNNLSDFSKDPVDLSIGEKPILSELAKSFDLASIGGEVKEYEFLAASLKKPACSSDKLDSVADREPGKAGSDKKTSTSNNIAKAQRD